MKKVLILSGALALMGLGLSSCSSDEPLGYQDEKVEADETQYLSVAICNPTNYQSRAVTGDNEDADPTIFNNGATSESDVKQLVFVFYDGAGAPTATMYSLLDTADEAIETGWSSNANGHDVERVWTSVIPVRMVQGQNRPVYVMCYVNPVDQTNLGTMTLSEIDKAVRGSIRGENGLFAMSNSVYYGNNPITGQTNVRMMATPIHETELYPTEEAAIAGPSVVDIYVERYAAKIGLTMAPEAVAEANYYEVALPAGGTAKLKFTPEYWRPNAIDEKTYITKAFSTGQQTEMDPTQPASYASLNAAFAGTGMGGTGTSGWNDPDNFRSYWACSPSYYANNYPQCSDNITDKGEGGTALNTYALKYFTFDEISAEKGKIAWNTRNGFLPATADNGTTSGYFYSRETTASIYAIQGEITKTIPPKTEGGTPTTETIKLNSKAVVASAVIVGRYQLSTATGAATTFYLYGKSHGKDVYYGTESDVEEALISNQNVIFVDAACTTRATDPDFFVVEHPSMAVRTNPETNAIDNVAGRLVTIQIPASAYTRNTLYFNNAGEIQRISAANITAANRLLWASASSAQMFYNGLAFFSIPIHHLGWSDARCYVKDDKGNIKTDWANLRRGDLGVVRNHFYSISVSSIKGLGTGLAATNQPIVPPMDPDDYYISAKLNILAWRVVPQQSVNL